MTAKPSFLAELQRRNVLRAGVLYIEVSVSVAVEYRDGRRRRLEGAYLLKRSTKPGATDEQRQWRISSALLREVTP